MVENVSNQNRLKKFQLLKTDKNNSPSTSFALGGGGGAAMKIGMATI